jgi:hypothetical protein
MGPYLLLDRLITQRYHEFLETVVPGLFEYVPPVVRQSCGFSIVQLQHTKGKMTSSGGTQHIQEGGLDVEGLLHELLGRQI